MLREFRGDLIGFFLQLFLSLRLLGQILVAIERQALILPIVHFCFEIVDFFLILKQFLLEVRQILFHGLVLLRHLLRPIRNRVRLDADLGFSVRDLFY